MRGIYVVSNIAHAHSCIEPKLCLRTYVSDRGTGNLSNEKRRFSKLVKKERAAVLLPGLK